MFVNAMHLDEGLLMKGEFDRKRIRYNEEEEKESKERSKAKAKRGSFFLYFVQYSIRERRKSRKNFPHPLTHSVISFLAKRGERRIEQDLPLRLKLSVHNTIQRHRGHNRGNLYEIIVSLLIRREE